LRDPPEKLNKGINFDPFRNLSEERPARLPKAPGGHPPYDCVLMFKILILQRYCNLSDDQVEFQINDRMSSGRIRTVSHRKTPMPAGQKRTVKAFSVTKTM
jgi:hypothetical protein